MKNQAGLKRFCVLCFVVMLILFIVHVQVLVMYNRQKVSIHGNVPGSQAYMEIDPRSNTTSRWLKRDYTLPGGQVADLIGQTIDETLYNNSGSMIRDWDLRININGDCFINQAWTGEMEIHQFADDGTEAVQQLDLRDYQLEDVTLKYQYDGDLLIPLKKGDYVVYYPNVHYNEMPVNNGDKITIGMIFYFLDDLDLSDYDLSVHFHRGFTQGWSFIAFIAFAALWFLSMVVYFTGLYTYRNARKQMEIRKSGLSYMSGLYEAIYIINLPTDEITPVSSGDYLEHLRARHDRAKELLNAAVKGDADEASLDGALAFVDLDTLPERLKGRENIVHEFYSRNHGWCRFRFFAMDRGAGNVLENAIFAVQDINEERSETMDLRDRLVRAESVATANSVFLSGASRDLRAPVRELLSLDEQLLSETDPEKIRRRAEDIRGVGTRMLTLLDGLADRAAAEAGNGKSVPVRWSLKDLVSEAFAAVRPLAEERKIRLETELSDALPDAFLGDGPKLREAVTSLLANALNHSADGSVRLSVFGSRRDDIVHLLFSVRFQPDQGEPAGLTDGKEPRGADQDLDLEVAGSLLAALGSVLKSVRSADDWKDTYFEIDQQAADSAPADPSGPEDTKR